MFDQIKMAKPSKTISVVFVGKQFVNKNETMASKDVGCHLKARVTAEYI